MLRHTSVSKYIKNAPLSCFKHEVRRDQSSMVGSSRVDLLKAKEVNPPLCKSFHHIYILITITKGSHIRVAAVRVDDPILRWGSKGFSLFGYVINNMFQCVALLTLFDVILWPHSLKHISLHYFTS